MSENEYDSQSINLSLKNHRNYIAKKKRWNNKLEKFVVHYANVTLKIKWNLKIKSRHKSRYELFI